MLPKKWIRGNDKLHVNKALCHAIMKRSRFENKANKTKGPTDIRNYKKHQNFVVNINKEAKLKYFSKCESNDNKTFWKNCKPYFTNKHSKADTDVILSDDGELILKITKIANTFNDHLESILITLAWITGIIIHCHRRKVLIGLIQRYKNHPSIKKLKEKFNNAHIFSFEPVFID